MPMKNPPHPGSGIRDDLDALGWSVAEAADALGVTRQRLYRVLNGTRGVTPEMALRLEAAIGASADTWLRMQASYDLAQARLKSSAIKVKKLTPKVASARAG